MSAKSTWLIAVGLVALVAPTLRSRAALAQVGAGNSFLITHVRVFDGDRTHEATDVAVERGVVRAVGRDLTTWRHLPVIDGTGATLLPGLIDAHAHVRSIDDLQEALRFGVTTVLDMGASGVTPGDLSETPQCGRVANGRGGSAIRRLWSPRAGRARHGTPQRHRG